MALIPGTNVGAPVVPYDTSDTYASHRAVYGQGGLRTVADTATRNLISQARCEEGMLVYVIATGITYQLRAGYHDPLVDGDWSIYSYGGIPTLQQVCDSGNTTTTDIVMQKTGAIPGSRSSRIQYIGQTSVADRFIRRGLEASSIFDTYEMVYTNHQGGNITAFANAGGGFVTVSAAGHDLAFSQEVEITGTVNYNGTYTVQAVVPGVSFNIYKTFVITETGTYRVPILKLNRYGSLLVGSTDTGCHIGYLREPGTGFRFTPNLIGSGSNAVYVGGNYVGFWSDSAWGVNRDMWLFMQSYVPGAYSRSLNLEGITGLRTPSTYPYCDYNPIGAPGLNDMESMGICTAYGLFPMVVEIDGTGTPDTFRWSNNGGASWNASGVAITGGAQALIDGISIRFNTPAPYTGHTLGDQWTWTWQSNDRAIQQITQCSSTTDTYKLRYNDSVGNQIYALHYNAKSVIGRYDGTHSLTFGNDTAVGAGIGSSAGIAMFMSLNQTSNYEVGRLYQNVNGTFTLDTEYNGSGYSRPLFVGVYGGFGAGMTVKANEVAGSTPGMPPNGVVTFNISGGTFNCPATVSSIQFTGSGLNDMSQSGFFTGFNLATYTITISDSVSSPDKFDWTCSTGGGVAGVSITAGVPQLLNNGMSITFAAGDGHTLGNRWVFSCGVAGNPIYSFMSGIPITWNYTGPQPIIANFVGVRPTWQVSNNVRTCDFEIRRIENSLGTQGNYHLVCSYQSGPTFAETVYITNRGALILNQPAQSGGQIMPIANIYGGNITGIPSGPAAKGLPDIMIDLQNTMMGSPRTKMWDNTGSVSFNADVILMQAAHGFAGPNARIFGVLSTGFIGGCPALVLNTALSGFTYTQGGAAPHNDMTATNTCSKYGVWNFRVRIDTIGATDTFQWSRDGGVSWEASTIPIPGVGVPYTLTGYGATVTFGSTTGHEVGDRWDWVSTSSSQAYSAGLIIGHPQKGEGYGANNAHLITTIPNVADNVGNVTSLFAYNTPFDVGSGFGVVSIGDTPGTVTTLGSMNLGGCWVRCDVNKTVTNPTTLVVNPPSIDPTSPATVTFTNAPRSATFGGLTYVGSRAYGRQSLTNDYPATYNDCYLEYTALVATRTVTLPSIAAIPGTPALPIGFTLTIKDGTGLAGGTNNIIIDGYGAETIDGALTYPINTNFGSVVLYNNGTQWMVLNATPAPATVTALTRIPVSNVDYPITTTAYNLIAYTSLLAAHTVTLPLAASVSVGWTVTVKDETGVCDTYNITVQRAGADTIDGGTDYVLSAPYNSVTFYSKGGTSWGVI